MGRSATLCGGKNGLVTPLNWNFIRDQRIHVNQNLLNYIKSESCVQGVPIQIPRKGQYLDELSKAFISILITELHNLDSPNKFQATVSFAIIYTEMWRQATLIGTQFPANDDSLRWVQPGGEIKELIPIAQLQRLNKKWENWTCSKLESDYFLSLAQNLSDSYLKVMEEIRVAAENKDETSLTHHAAVIGDIFQEMLALHETLMPRKNSRFTEVLE